jgi:hypothetical protein
MQSGDLLGTGFGAQRPQCDLDLAHRLGVEEGAADDRGGVVGPRATDDWDQENR